MDFIIALIIVIVTASLVAILVFISCWTTHIAMNRDENKPYDFVNFNTFIREFKKYENDPNLEIGFCGQSIFLKQFNGRLFDYILYLHADIVKINDKCMIFYPLDYIKYKIWMKKFIKNKGNRVKGLWSIPDKY